jgi:hypothetical protein
MGKPNLRLNPKVEGRVNRQLLELAVSFLFCLLPKSPKIVNKSRGRPGWDRRLLLVLLVLMGLLKKTYAAYEAEMRTNETLFRLLSVKSLPSKSCLQRFAKGLTTDYLRSILKAIAYKYCLKCANMFVDSTGFVLNKASSWFNIRIKRKVSKKDHYKLHALCLEKWQLILDFRITRGTKHDGPILRYMLSPLKKIGLFFGDGAYSCRKTLQMIEDRDGSPFIRFAKNATGKSKSYPAWRRQFLFFKAFPVTWFSIYHQRSKMEGIFSAIKRRYGDKLRSRTRKSRNRELLFRIIAYNLRQALCIEYALANNLPLWVRAK